MAEPTSESSPPYIVTSQALCEGSASKICDCIADACLDACLEYEPKAKVSIDVAAHSGLILIFGDVIVSESQTFKVDFEGIARTIC